MKTFKFKLKNGVHRAGVASVTVRNHLAAIDETNLDALKVVSLFNGVEQKPIPKKKVAKPAKKTEVK